MFIAEVGSRSGLWELSHARGGQGRRKAKNGIPWVLRVGRRGHRNLEIQDRGAVDRL